MASLDDYRKALLEEGSTTSTPPALDPGLEAYRRVLIPEPTTTTQPDPQSEGFGAAIKDPVKFYSNLKNFADQQISELKDAAKNIPQGIEDTALTVARGIRAVNKAVPALAAVDKAVGFKTGEEADKDTEARIAASKAYEATPESKTLPAQVGRAAGQQVLTLPATIGAGALLRAGGALVGPTVGRLANFATGAGGTLSNAAAGAGANIISNALNYGASDKNYFEHLGDNIGTAAMLGAAGRFIPTTASNVYNYGRTLINSLTEPGQTRIANQILTRYMGGSPNLQQSPIPGVELTLPEAIEGGSPGAARLWRTLHNGQENGALEARMATNNAARQEFYQQLAGTGDDLTAAIANRSAQEGAAIGHVFQPGQTTDAAPVLQKIDDIMNNSASRKDPVVQSVLDNVRKTLIERQPMSGLIQPVEDPVVLYKSTRGLIDRILQSRLGPNSETIDKTVAGHLMDVKGELDKAIESGAPGFKQALSDFAEASKPINQMEFLQSARTNNADEVTLNTIKALRDKAIAQRASPGANDAKALTDAQMEALENLYQDLQKPSKVNIGKAHGSDTVQNVLSEEMLAGVTPGGANRLVSALSRPGTVGMMVGGGVGHLLGGPYGGVGGSLAGGAAAEALHMAATTRNNEIRAKILERILNPDMYTPVRPTMPLPVNDLLPGAVAGSATPALMNGNR